MSERKHTPGPWIGFADQGNTVAILPAGRDGAICDFASTVKEADASLMIAAPDLLPANTILAAILDAYEADCGEAGMIIPWASWRNVSRIPLTEQDCINARIAVNKATGSTP